MAAKQGMKEQIIPISYHLGSKKTFGTLPKSQHFWMHFALLLDHPLCRVLLDNALCSVSCDNAVCSVSCDKALYSMVTMHSTVCRVTLQCVAWQICTLWRVKMHPAVCHVTFTAHVQCVKWQCTLQFVAWQWTLHFVVGQYTLQCVAWRDGTFPQEWTTSRGMICY